MRHDLTCEGHAYRLRPIALSDAADIVRLRRDPELNRFIHPTSADVKDQEPWFEAYFDRPGDYYFAVERRDGDFEGTIGLYYLDEGRGDAEWGRWILRPGSLAALESALMIYRLGFERLGLREIYCRTVADNAPVLAFHDSMGLPRVAVHPALFALDGRMADAVEHRLSRDAFAAMASDLDAKARRLGRLIARQP